MTEVYIDSQLVKFNGQNPENLIDLISIITNTLEQENRYFVGISADSFKNLDNNLLKSSLNNFKVVKITSASEFHFISELIEQNKETIEHLIHSFHILSKKILSIQFKDILCLINMYLQDIQTLLNSIKSIDSWAKKNSTKQSEIIKCIYEEYEQFLLCVENSLKIKDIGMLSEMLNQTQIFENHLKFLQQLPLQNNN